jgi:hypothetical protein
VLLAHSISTEVCIEGVWPRTGKYGRHTECRYVSGFLLRTFRLGGGF